jgi:excisionase family DNA binding protein
MATNEDGRQSERLLLTVPEVAERLAVGRSTVYELTAAGELEVVHIGRYARIPVASLSEFVQRKRDHAVTKR